MHWHTDTPLEIMLELSVLFSSIMMKCEFSPSPCYIESLICGLLRNMGSVFTSKWVLWTFDYSELHIINPYPANVENMVSS